MRWLIALLTETNGPLERQLELAPPLQTRWRITCDASPWGLGAVLYHEGTPLEWLAIQLNCQDESLFGVETGTSEAISIW